MNKLKVILFVKVVKVITYFLAVAIELLRLKWVDASIDDADWSPDKVAKHMRTLQDIRSALCCAIAPQTGMRVFDRAPAQNGEPATT